MLALKNLQFRGIEEKGKKEQKRRRKNIIKSPKNRTLWNWKERKRTYCN
jgi:hypothetical protein